MSDINIMNIIATNALALNAANHLKSTEKKKAGSAEKLSSGYKVNRSADDAAGLTISEGMRRQIRGLNQASANCQDGISLCQVADGALTETQDILHRMTELSIKSANGTNTQEDRAAIQAEITQLKEEINRVADTTSFNDAIYPLSAIHTDGTRFNDGVVLNDYSETYKEKKWGVLLADTHEVINGTHYFTGDTVTLKGITTTGSDTTVMFDGWNNIETFSSPAEKEYAASAKDREFICPWRNTYWISVEDLKSDDNGYVYYDSRYDGSRQYLTVKDDNTELLNMATIDEGAATALGRKYVKLFDESSDTEAEWESPDAIRIQAGADGGVENGIYIKMVDATTSGIGISTVNVSTREAALNSIELINKATDKVSSYRSYFGAKQNRMEHTIRNLDNTSENTQNAESLIRDTNMANEMVQYSKANILEQVNQSMLVQANQSNQGVLSLLQ